MRIAAGVQLDRGHTELLRLFDRRPGGIDEETHADTRVGQRLDCVFDARGLADNVESTFGGDLFAALRHQCHLLRLETTRYLQHFRYARRLEVEVGAHTFFQSLDIGVLNMASVLPQMSRYSIRPCRFTDRRRLNGIRLLRAPSLPQRGDVVNIDIEALLLCSHCRRP